MNEGEIAEVFIRAAEIDRSIPGRVGPAKPRSLQLPYVHDYADKLGWGKSLERRVVKRRKLLKGDWLTEDPLAEERRLFWERMGFSPTAEELSGLDVIYEWLTATGEDEERRALLAWARAKAGGRAFKKWCEKVERIHPETGRRRKDRALLRIASILGRRPLQNNENPENGELPRGPEFEDIPDTLATDAGDREDSNSWLAQGAIGVMGEPEDRDFSWAEKRNELRRQREERKRRQAAKEAKRDPEKRAA